MNQISEQQIEPTLSMLALLASGYDSGLVLCCGETLKTYCHVIAGAMPMTSRLVLNVETDLAHEQAQSLAALDIRIAVHKQDHLSFLDDISRYYFNLILIENNKKLPEVIQVLLDKLMPGGIMIILKCKVGEIQPCLPDSDWHVVDTKWPDQAVIIGAISPIAQRTQRKGGRRAKLAEKL